MTSQSTVSAQTILITGGTGFAGSHLVDALLEKNETQVHVTSYGPDTGHVSQVLPADHLHQLDLTEFTHTKDLLEKLQPTQIYHLAALAGVGTSFDKLKQVLDANTQIQLSLLTAVKEVCPQAKVLSIGSALEYQPQDTPLKETDPLGPVSPYGVSKVTQDMLAYAFYRQDNLQIIRTRSFNHFGERQAPGFVVVDFASQIAGLAANQSSGQPHEIKVGNLQAVRDFTYVKDVVEAYILLMEKGEAGEVYNVGSGEGVTIQQILDWLIEFSGKEIHVKIDQEKFRPIDVPKVIAQTDKIKQLGWQPSTNIKQALEQTYNYYLANI